MAWPFAQFPTLGDFIAKALDSGCVRVLPPGEIHGPSGPISVRVLRRPGGIPVVLPNMDDMDRLTPTVFYGLCRKLALSPQLFDAPEQI